MAATINDPGKSRPLCVDLDGTLIRTDLLYESLLRMLGSKPWLLFALPFWLLKGKAHIKQKLASFGIGDPALLPYDWRVVELLRESSTRELVLCTASDESIANPIANYLGVFDKVIASNGIENLAGAKKARHLVSLYGDRGFDYVANASVDAAVWRHSHSAWVVNGGNAIAQVAERSALQVEAHWPAENGGIKSWLKAARLHQWLKNLLVFVPLLASHKFLDVEHALASMLAFVAFGLCASGVYLLNDMLDLESDRQHPRKRLRPFASGDLTLRGGMLAVPLLTLAGFLMAGLASPAFAFILCVYLALTLGYSLKLKQIAMVDVVLLAALYTIRIVGGAAAIGVTLSFWLLTFSMFFFLSLAMLKRYTELLLARNNGKNIAHGRGYHIDDLSLVQSLGSSAGLVAVLVLCLYINAPESQELYRQPLFLWLLCPVLLYWISRTWMLAHRGVMHDDPVVFAVKDRVSLATVAIGLLAVLAAI